jgi:AraC-like DNA-binding protein
MVSYRQISPGPATAEFIHCYWFLQGASSGLETQRIVPDGRPELIIHLGSPFEHQQGQTWVSQPECFLVGQITGPMLVRPNGAANTLGIRFHPHGASRLFGIPLEKLSGKTLPLCELSPEMYRELSRLRDLRTSSLQIAHVDRVLLRFFLRKKQADRITEGAVSQILSSGGVIETSELAFRLGISTRQLQRKFKMEVGIGPKLLGRIQRFQRVFAAFESSRDWAQVAVQCGYYDQAHLIRDFRELSGEAPAALLTFDTDLAFHFLERTAKSEAMSEISKTAAPSP